MIQYSEAIEILKNSASRRRLGSEVVPLELSLGRYLSEPLLSPESVPPFDNSAMDGFAVYSALTLGATRERPVILRVLGTIAAGDNLTGAESAGSQETAWEIMTGAPIPLGGFDAVVKVEDVETKRLPDGKALEIRVFKPVAPQENVRGVGEDFSKGVKVAAPGTLIQPEHLMALASLGMDQVPVVRRPKIALISTGRELAHHSEKHLEPGMIRNSTAPYLIGAVPRLGADCTYFGSIPDDPARFIELLEQVLATQPDVVVTTGAVSMGKYDFVGSCLEQIGTRQIFHKVAIRPGKPLLFAEKETSGPVFFGVPGNPVSTSVGVRFFLAPYLRTLMGLPDETPHVATLSKNSKKPEGLRCFFKGATSLSDRGLVVEALAGQASFMVSPLLKANSWVVFDENGEKIEKGERVTVFPLFPDDAGLLSERAFDHAMKEKGCC